MPVGFLHNTPGMVCRASYTICLRLSYSLLMSSKYVLCVALYSLIAPVCSRVGHKACPGIT